VLNQSASAVHEDRSAKQLIQPSHAYENSGWLLVLFGPRYRSRDCRAPETGSPQHLGQLSRIGNIFEPLLGIGTNCEPNAN